MTNEQKDIEQRIRWLISQRNRIDGFIAFLLSVWEEGTEEDWDARGFIYKEKTQIPGKKRTKTCKRN